VIRLHHRSEHDVVAWKCATALLPGGPERTAQLDQDGLGYRDRGESGQPPTTSVVHVISCMIANRSMLDPHPARE
jgi:hypothetical protein